MSALEVEVVGPAAGSTATPGPADKPVAIDILPEKQAPSMSDAIKERLAALRESLDQKTAPPKVDKPTAAPAEAKPADAPAPTETVEAVTVDDDEKPAEAEPDKPAPPPEWEAEKATLQGVTQRQRGIIEKLEADLAAAKKASESSATARAKRIDEAEEAYVRSPAGAVKQFVAAALGLDADSEAHKQELLDLFVDLTAELSGATPDAAHQAKRGSALIRRELDLKDKRRAAGDKQTAEQGTPSEREAQQNQAIGIVADGFKPVAAKYPHLTGLAAKLDKRSVESVLWEVIDTGIKRGDFDGNTPDDVLIAKAATLAENYYKDRWTELQAAIPSTATPGVPPAPKQEDKPAAVPSKTDKRQGNGRSLSNADASVAPSQTPPPPKDEKPTFKTDEERRRWATRHLRE